MPAAPKPSDEEKRLSALHDLGILDTPPDAEFDALVRAATLVCDVPISLISLVDEKRQWFKANIGMPGVTETPRELAFCGHSVLSGEFLEIHDATQDPRVADNPLVLAEPSIRFYAAVPLRLSNGAIVGTLCVIDRQPQHLTEKQRELLFCLAQVAICALESWRARQLKAESAALLRDSEMLLRQQYQSTPAMLHSQDENGAIVAVSDMWLSKLGYARNEVIGRSPLEFLTPQSQKYAQAVVLPQFLATGRCEQVPYQMMCKDGSVLDILLSTSVEHDSDRRRPASRTFIEDVTRRLAAERALTAERRRLTNLIESTAMGTWEWNMQTGEVRINARWAELIGFSIADLEPLTGATWYARIHPDDKIGAEAHLLDHLAGKTERYDCEFRTQHRDGHWVWVFSRGAVVTFTDDGRPEWLFATRKDISDRKRQEEALRKSEDFLDRTGRAAGVGGWELDLLTHEVYWSAETHRIHNVPSSYRPTLESAMNFYPPPAQEILRNAIKQSEESGEGWDLELPLTRADGREIWVRAVGTVSLIAGKAVRVTGAVQDVTERVAERLALQNANERIKLAAQAGGIGLWDWDLVSGVKIWDRQMHLLYGMDAKTGPVSYEGWRRHVHPEDVAFVAREVKAALDGLRPYDAEFRVVWDDGSIHHMRGAGQVTRDSIGRAVRMFGVNWDVTQSRALAAELTVQLQRQAEASERETAIFRNSPDSLSIICVTEENGEQVFRIEALSPAFELVTGWRASDFIGKRLEECLPADIVRSTRAELLECLAKDATILFTTIVDTPKGRREFEGSRTPIRSTTGSKTIRIAGAMRDVTERNRLEAARHHGQKMEAIGRLASGVAHDFNNILQSISGSLELVQDEVTPGTSAHEYAAIGLRSAKRGSYLTHHLLSYARKQLLRPKIIELPVLLSDLEKLLARTLGPNIEVKVRADPAAQIVRADPGQIQTALLNLAINASHAMPYGGTLLIDSRPVIEDEQHWLSISVTDSGSGMDEATLARAVEPFFTTKGLNGTGLGLSMVQGFIEQSGGRMRIRSGLGQGTTVVLLLPAATVPAPEKTVLPEQRTEKSACVLLVDDDPDVLITTGAFLEKAGFRILRVANANEALASLAEGAKIDAVVTDYAMPGMNGGDLIAEIRMKRAGLPGIIISGFNELTDTAGLSDTVITLHKPFQRDALISALRRLLGWDAKEASAC